MLNVQLKAMYFEFVRIIIAFVLKNACWIWVQKSSGESRPLSNSRTERIAFWEYPYGKWWGALESVAAGARKCLESTKSAYCHLICKIRGVRSAVETDLENKWFHLNPSPTSKCRNVSNGIAYSHRIEWTAGSKKLIRVLTWRKWGLAVTGKNYEEK